jgi:hypothetical protein
MRTLWLAIIVGPAIVAGFIVGRPLRLTRPRLLRAAVSSDAALLGLSSGAPPSEIKRAYRTAVVPIHPDRNTTEAAKVPLPSPCLNWLLAVCQLKHDFGDRFENFLRPVCL